MLPLLAEQLMIDRIPHNQVRYILHMMVLTVELDWTFSSAGQQRQTHVAVKVHRLSLRLGVSSALLLISNIQPVKYTFSPLTFLHVSLL